MVEEENKNINISTNSNDKPSVKDDMNTRPSRFKFNKLSLRKLTSRNKTIAVNKNIINKKEIEEEIKRMNRTLRNTTPYDLCINSLLKHPSVRDIELNKKISFYIRNLKNFMNILSNEDDEELEQVLYDISSHLKYEKYNTNQIICKYGDTADKFYIILKGQVIFLVPKISKHYLSEEEYLLYLINLRKKGELELIKKTLVKNQLIYYYGDNLDEYILNCLERHEKNNENIYSNRIYNIFYEFKAFIEKEKNNKNTENKIETINIDEYIGNTVINSYDNLEYAKLKGKKLISIFQYQKTNIYKDGDSFGSDGISNKNNKRTATSVCYENCHIGFLTKEEYIDILEKVNNKARERLYELTISNKIFSKMSKHLFINNYIHMFHFAKYSKDDIIMNDNEKFSKIIILYAGEFVLTIKKNLIELNDLIIRVKQIRGKMLNIPEELLKKDLKEIKENKTLLINMKFTSSNLVDVITKKQNYIITKVKEQLVLGYPNSIDPETSIPLFNCICISDSAMGYKVENNNLKNIKESYFIRKSAPEISISMIDLLLERLLDIKTIILSKINDTQKYQLYETVSIKKKNDSHLENTSENKKNNSIENNEEDENIAMARNYVPKKTDTSSVLFDFNKKIISFGLTKSLKKKKKQILSPLNKRLLTEKKNINKINKNTNTAIKEFFSLMFKYKKNILEKNKLLRSVQKQSRKFLLRERIEQKQLQMNLNKLKSKEEYNDFSSIFAKYPYKKKTILDKFNAKKTEDNVLDPIIKDIKRELNIYNKTSNNLIQNKTISNTETNTKTNEQFEKLVNELGINTNLNTIDTNGNMDKENKELINRKSRSIRLNKLKNKNKLIYSHNNHNNLEFMSFYANTDINNSTNQKSTCYSNEKNLTTINLNDINISKKDTKYFNDKDKQKDLYYMLYLNYIMDELNNKTPNNNFQSLSVEKFRTLNTDNHFLNKDNNKRKKLIMPLIGNKNKNNLINIKKLYPLHNENKNSKETI